MNFVERIPPLQPSPPLFFFISSYITRAFLHVMSRSSLVKTVKTKRPKSHPLNLIPSPQPRGRPPLHSKWDGYKWVTDSASFESPPHTGNVAPFHKNGKADTTTSTVNAITDVSQIPAGLWKRLDSHKTLRQVKK